ncbi:MAG: ricin-type beta-trefoil lectin domain protein [Pseudomonadota bacterium]|nr:ricin-type beta-trefoil lectin domain protein [Pseudomonadota bacterium]
MKRSLVSSGMSLGIALAVVAWVPLAHASNRMVSQHAPSLCLGDSGGTAVLGSCSDSIADFTGYGQIKSHDRCLTSHGKGAALTWASCGNTPTQRWGLQGNGQLNNESGWCADVERQGTAQGTHVIAYDCPRAGSAPPNNQKWRASTVSTQAPLASITNRVPTLGDVELQLKIGGNKMTLAQVLDYAARSNGNVSVAQVLKVISNDGGSLISQDGGTFRVMSDARLIGQDGSTFRLVNGVISNDGGTLVGNSGGTLVTDNGSGLARQAANAAGSLPSAGLAPRQYQAGTAPATCTPWVVAMFNEFNPSRTPSVDQCSPDNYTGGKWKSSNVSSDIQKLIDRLSANPSQAYALMAKYPELLTLVTTSNSTPPVATTPSGTTQAAKDSAMAAYKAKYGGAEAALKSAFPGSPSKLDPVQSDRNGVWSVDPAPAVKHFAEVDRPSLGSESAASYLTNISHPKNGDVAGWYMSNFQLSGGMTAQPMNAYDAKYGGAETALKSAFPGSNAKLVRSTPRYSGGQWVVDPAPAVKHAAEVDEPVRGKGAALLNYLRQPDVAGWYMANFSLIGGTTTPSPVVAQVQAPAPVRPPTTTVAPAPSTPIPVPQPVLATAPAGPNCANAGLTAALKAQNPPRGTPADSGTSGLCNPSRYRGADRNPAALNVNQPEINDLVKQSFYCPDPWIGQIWAEREQGYKQLGTASGSLQPPHPLCNINLYNRGSWTGWDNLRQLIQTYHRNNPNA